MRLGKPFEAAICLEGSASAFQSEIVFRQGMVH
jgi:hypothetical protein